MKTVLLVFLVYLASVPYQSKAEKSCPDDWTKILGKCYRVFNQAKTCSEAENFCSDIMVTCCGEDTTAHLATIPDCNTQKKLRRLVNDMITEENGWAFIGLQYDTEMKADTWTDGFPVYKTFWANHQPCNNQPGTCAVITKNNNRFKNWVAKTQGTRGNHICMLPCITEIK